MKTGTYIGPEKLFRNQRALVKDVYPHYLKAQFNEGPLWMTHSWITFPREHWKLDAEQQDGR